MPSFKTTPYLFFWGHHPKKEGIIDKSCLSQWYPSKMVICPSFIEGALYDIFPTAEHYMMAKKARLFNDIQAYKNILAAATPKQAKEIGRTVKNFNEEIWKKNRYEIVLKVTRAKFLQNTQLRDFLYSTRGLKIVEASPNDAIWGIGISINAPNIQNPEQWHGLNLLGKALTQVRDELYSSFFENISQSTDMIFPIADNQWIEINFDTPLDRFNFTYDDEGTIWLVTDNEYTNIGIFNTDPWKTKIKTLQSILNNALSKSRECDTHISLNLEPFSEYFDKKNSITLSIANTSVWHIHINQLINSFNEFIHKINIPSE